MGTEKAEGHEGQDNANFSWCARNGTQEFDEVTGRTGSERIKTIQTKPLQRSSRIQRWSWRPEEICCHSDTRKTPPANNAEKNTQEIIIIIIIISTSTLLEN